MPASIVSLLRGIWQLRHPELVRLLGDKRQSIEALNKVRESCPGSIIHHDVLVQGWPQGSLTLGEGVRIEKGCILALGDELNGYGALDVGANTWIGQYNNFRLSGGTRISIGKGVLVSQFCSLIAANHNIASRSPIKHVPCDSERTNIQVGDDVWLGAGAAIMPSVNIGKGVVVGANSVVTQSIPEYEIWAGAPAHKIGERV